LIPSFAVGRAQLVLYYLHELMKAGSIPDLPVYLNSPMAMHANEIFCRHAGEHRLSSQQAHAVCSVARTVRTVEESIELNAKKGPMIVIAASGMATGGRVLHHLKAFAPDPRNTILFVGFQAGGTRGEQLVHGAKTVKIHGEQWDVKAEVLSFDSMSAHGDRDDILAWLGELKRAPRQVFVTHGEPSAAESLGRAIEERFQWNANVPKLFQTVEL
jgi:metallo-beta-lactamase family protein